MKQPGDEKQGFCMTVLALKTAECSNGVSALHGEVSREMWQDVWPDVPEHEVPIKSLTNGIHIPSWVSHDMANLLERYLGPDWVELPSETDIWQRIDRIPGEELWRTHERRRERLIAFARARLQEQLRHRGASKQEVETANEILNPEALTIGFARRFATYKRATLLFEDLDRLKSILCDPDRPVQLIFAGKAHPHDNQGKELIRQIIHKSRDIDLRMHLVFLEDYDACIARYMVQGCDLWLNTPRRPLEASGTSGMKVVPNGGMNCSILDGWWVEAYTPDTGWAIGRGEEYEDEAYEDEVEVSALYNLLEKEIVPLFYDRDRSGLPRDWIAKMKSSMKAICPIFNTSRMVQEYAGRFYLPCHRRYQTLAADDLKRSRDLAAWKERVRRGWGELEIVSAAPEEADNLRVSNELMVAAEVKLGNLRPEDIEAQLYYSRVGSDGKMLEGDSLSMSIERESDGVAYYRGRIVCQRSGRFGFIVRVVPNHPDMMIKHEMGLVLWEKREETEE
jgi:starch phosphorylase